ncbi:MAG TPA: GNAT family N-acetyltransferase, partial [Candidatus Dormibacteraeota bacterium]
PATQADREKLLSLIRGYFDFYQTAFPGAAQMGSLLDRLDTDEGLGIVLVAQEGNDLLGFATLYSTFDTLVAGPILVMNDLFVSAQARRAGIGAALLAAARQYGAEKGYLRIDWVTANDNLAAQRFYDRQGGRRGNWTTYSLPVR